MLVMAWRGERRGMRVGDDMWIAGGRSVEKVDVCEMGGERALDGICNERGGAFVRGRVDVTYCLMRGRECCLGYVEERCDCLCTFWEEVVGRKALTVG